MMSPTDVSDRHRALPPLVEFTVDGDGASMHCHYCTVGQPLCPSDDVPVQILQFQEAHFSCDPVLHLPSRQAGHHPGNPPADLAAATE